MLEDMESNVRAYCRRWPVTFTEARGAWVSDDQGREYLDFFAGAGSLNYGHNPPVLIESLTSYLRSGGVLNSLDTMTTAKRDFLKALLEILLAPRRMDYRVQFTGPTGTCAVEAAIRLARIATGRGGIMHFSGSYHGGTLDAAAVSGMSAERGLPCVPLWATAVAHECDEQRPGDSVLFADHDPRDYNPPAAFLIETVQGEGGARAASSQRLQAIDRYCKSAGCLLIVDDIQAGCGRTGPFFSFENDGISPDIICLSKSLSGLGLPLSLNLIKPSVDAWLPGEFSGTFRGNNLGFVTARSALLEWWVNDDMTKSVKEKSGRLRSAVTTLANSCDWMGHPTGRGLMIGLPCADRFIADSVSRFAFEAGLLVETCGTMGQVVKLLPPITAEWEELEHGLRALTTAMDRADSAFSRNSR
jgi:diaminobutyrate-2-oxoglutarate transaminase